MSEIYDKYLTIDQQKKIKAIPDERRWNNYRNFDLELEVWDTFWNKTFKWDKEEKPAVLDYGCGLGNLEISDLIESLQPFVNDSKHHVTIYSLTLPKNLPYQIL